MKRIELSNGEQALVSDRDYKHIATYKWHPHTNGYAYAKIRGRRVLMHRLIMGTPKGMDTDHKNHNRLDNRRVNLRICTHIDNLQNKRPYKGGLGGISWDKSAGKWLVRIQQNRKRVHHGRYLTYQEAQEVLQTVRAA